MIKLSRNDIGFTFNVS